MKRPVICLISILMLFAAVAVAGEVHAPGGVERGIEKLASRDFRERNLGARELVKIGLPAVGPLIAILQDGPPDLRWRAALVLGKIKAPRAVLPLITSLVDRNWLVRFWAAWSLGEMKDRRAVKPLIGLLSDSEMLVVRMALDSLREITGEGFGRDPAKWRGLGEK